MKPYRSNRERVMWFLCGFALMLIALSLWTRHLLPTAPPPSPYSLEQCDAVLVRADMQWGGAKTLEDASMATACYLSHLARK